MEKYLTYEQFGATGDGITDDFDAIIATHEEANKTGTPVRAKDGAKYYIGGKDAHAVIKTDVCFGNAEFIIDDRSVEKIRTPIFTVESDAVPFTPDIRTLTKGQTRVDFPHEGNVFVQVKNANKPIFIRKGLNMNSGNPTQEVFIVDGDGNVLTTIDWDYPEITFATAKSIDDHPITLEGGIFTTVSNRAEAKYNYHYRNISITRSNVTVTGIRHNMVDVPEEAAPYAGFIDVGCCANVRICDSVFTPRFIYWTESKIPGQKVAMGSYGLSFNSSIGITCKNLTQTVDIHDTRYWGLVCSNFCKDLTFEDCCISRFDAHQGVSNVTLKGCTFGHQYVRLTGFGVAHIERCHIYGGQFVALRGDYGSFFDGEIVVKDCVWHTLNAKKLSVIAGYNHQDHDFGYECRMPSVTIDGLTIDDKSSADAAFYVLPNYNPSFTGTDEKYPYVTTKLLRIRKMMRASGGKIDICENPAQYKDLTVIEEN